MNFPFVGLQQHTAMNMTSQASNMSGPLSHSSPYYITPGKYQENGDTLSDFVNLVCQEAQNSGPSPQVSPFFSFHFSFFFY